METNKNEYYFVSVEDTIKYGIIQAAIIGRVKHWCKYNEEKKVEDRFHKGEWWSGFMSSYDFELQLGINRKTIESNLSKLLKSGILIKDVFNKHKRDRTGWYRVNPFPKIEETHLLQDSNSISYNMGNPFTTKEEMDLPLDGKPLPVSPSVNLSVNQKLSNIPVNPPVKPKYKFISWNKYDNRWEFNSLTNKQRENLPIEEQDVYNLELDKFEELIKELV